MASKTSIAGSMLRQKWRRWMVELERMADKKFYVDNEGWSKALEEEVGADVAEIISDHNISNSNNNDQLRKLIEDLKNRKTWRLTVAMKPTRKILNQLEEWAEANFPDPVVIDLEEDTEIIGGLKSVYEGRVIEATIAAKWDELWEKHGLEWMNLTKGGS